MGTSSLVTNYLPTNLANTNCWIADVWCRAPHKRRVYGHALPWCGSRYTGLRSEQVVDNPLSSAMASEARLKAVFGCRKFAFLHCPDI